MYAGRIVERGPVDEIFAHPRHPYTQGLIKSVPRLDRFTNERLQSIQGQPPNVIDLPDCCPFYPRCDKAMDICKQKYPASTSFDDGCAASCWLYSREAR
jgi:oligopeptide transport system ATP-binding protein